MRTRQKWQSQNKPHPTGNKQRRGRPTAIKRGRPGPYAPPHNPRHADHWRLRRQGTTTMCRARPGHNTMTVTSDRPTATNLRTNREDNKDNIRLRQCGLQRNRPHDEQVNRKAATTTIYQQKCCRENDPTIDRPHASWPPPNQPGMQGSEREWRSMGWRHHGAPSPLNTIPKDMTQRRNSTILELTNQPQRITSNPGPPGRAQDRPCQEA